MQHNVNTTRAFPPQSHLYKSIQASTFQEPRTFKRLLFNQKASTKTREQFTLVLEAVKSASPLEVKPALKHLELAMAFHISFDWCNVPIHALLLVNTNLKVIICLLVSVPKGVVLWRSTPENYNFFISWLHQN